jgi:hypothetical protein
MTWTYIAMGVAGVVSAAAVVVGALVVLQPVYQKPFEPGQWIPTVFAGVAAILAGGAAVAHAVASGEATALSWTEGLIGGAVALVGGVLTALGIWIYEPEDIPEQHDSGILT